MRKILGFLILYEVGTFLWHQQERNRKYKEAEEKSRETGKKLVVLGGPWGDYSIRKWLNLPAHPPGDITIDKTPESFYPDGAEFIQKDIAKGPLPFPDNSVVMFCAHLLEHLTPEEFNFTISEIIRVSGGNYYICYPRKFSIIAHFISDHKLWLNEDPVTKEIDIEPTLWYDLKLKT